MSKRRKLPKIPNLNTDQRVQIARIVTEWASATAYLLQALHAGSYGVRHRHRLSAVYHERHAEKRRKAQASGARCQAIKAFAALPAYSRQKAYGMKFVVDSYCSAITNELTAGFAERVARALSVLIFDKAIHPKTLRRKIARLECCDPERIPMEAFADQLSVPHRKKKT